MYIALLILTTMSIAQKCLFYFVQLSRTGEPLLGTMFAKPNNKLDKGETACTEARLPATQMLAPQGQHQCFFKSGLRYYYKVDNYGQVVPNSLFSQHGPSKHCTGNFTILEYKTFA